MSGRGESAGVRMLGMAVVAVAVAPAYGATIQKANNTTALTSACSWPAATRSGLPQTGRTLTVAAVPVRVDTTNATTANSDTVGGTLRITTTGTVMIGTSAKNLLTDSGGNPFVTYGLNDWAGTDGTGKVVAANPATYDDLTASYTSSVALP